jgi:hypothetical protein
VRVSLLSTVFVFPGKILTKGRIVRCFLATRGHFAAERPRRSAAHLTGRPGPLYRVAGWLLHLILAGSHPPVCHARSDSTGQISITTLSNRLSRIQNSNTSSTANNSTSDFQHPSRLASQKPTLGCQTPTVWLASVDVWNPCRAV